MDDRYGMQGRCLQNGKTPDFMHIYDEFDPTSRKRLRESVYDICCACVRDIATEIMLNRRSYAGHELYICEAIDQIERQIRFEESPQAQ
jgi:hypothetical protein